MKISFEFNKDDMRLLTTLRNRLESKQGKVGWIAVVRWLLRNYDKEKAA
jgi:hypothetical protein